MVRRVSAVVVVGAGIVGASVAYHLARAGADVVLLDTSLPATGASGDSFAWIGRGPSDAPPEQALLRRSVLEDYRRLERELAGVRVRWSGSLSWGQDEPTDVVEGPGADAGDTRLVDDRQVTRLEPHLRTVPARATLRDSDGAVDPVAVTEALVSGAVSYGAHVRTGVTASALQVDDHRLVGVSTSAGFLPARTVVLAAGADASPLCATLGFTLPLVPSPALLMRLSAAPGLVRTLVSNAQIEVREAADGHLLIACEYRGESTQQDLDRAGERMLARLTSSFSGAEDVRLISVRVGRRPMPADGSPVIGGVPGAAGAYLAVMHSGVTLAATVGRLVASELVDGVDAEELRQLRPSRFTRAPTQHSHPARTAALPRVDGHLVVDGPEEHTDEIGVRVDRRGAG